MQIYTFFQKKCKSKKKIKTHYTITDKNINIRLFLHQPLHYPKGHFFDGCITLVLHFKSVKQVGKKCKTGDGGATTRG